MLPLSLRILVTMFVNSTERSLGDLCVISLLLQCVTLREALALLEPRFGHLGTEVGSITGSQTWLCVINHCSSLLNKTWILSPDSKPNRLGSPKESLKRMWLCVVGVLHKSSLCDFCGQTVLRTCYYGDLSDLFQH